MTLPSESVLQQIRDQIAVPSSVLKEARARRDLVLESAMKHAAARDRYPSGSVAHGTTNKPLEDADGGIVVDRRFEAFRAYGPDAPGDGLGPRRFVAVFAEFIEPRVRTRYPDVVVTAEGRRAIKIEFNEIVDIDDWGKVDPYVDFIVGLAQADGSGLWIPNLYTDTWDAGDPIHHTWLMTERDQKALRVFRAHILRLAKRAVKRDAHIKGRAVMCSWNLSALAVESITEVTTLSRGLAEFLRYASNEVAAGLTPDPSPAVPEPIKLPDGVTNAEAAARLGEMAEVVEKANEQLSLPAARTVLEALFGDEIVEIRKNEDNRLRTGMRRRDGDAVASVLGSATSQKVTSSYAV